MIVETVINLIVNLICSIFSFIDLPDMPDQVVSVIDTFFGLLENGIGLVSIVFDMSFLKIVIPVLILLINFEKVYWFIMWIIKKLPFSIE